MKFLCINGSHRKDSQSLKIGQWLCDQAALEHENVETDIIDLAVEDIPFWSEDAWDKDSALSAKMNPYQQRVAQADALMLIAPEWGGMVPAGLKNFLLYLGSHHCAHKPALIVGVSSGRGGKYPVSELRISGFKNNRLLYIPDHLIVQDCENVMNDHDLDAGENGDREIKGRASYTLGVLAAYAKALKGMREEKDLLDPAYPFGM